ncbi:MAG: PEP-CTERM sorting domain-containing protein [Verrucomicrobiota bacterium JB022]|nr:PEP-CTERM sorting domain-containing protein [Verrucomicrobiota bacterium JB022]
MKISALALLSTLAVLPVFGASKMQLVNQMTVGAGGAEILSYHNGTIASTAEGGIQLYSFGAGASITQGAFADFSGSFGTSSGLSGISSTAIDPMGRGFGLATLIPNSNGGEVGQLGFYDTTTGAVLGSINVGYHPDSVIFSKDGQWAFVANEGENGSSGGEQAGSITAINLGGVTNKGNAVTNAVSNTYDFQGQDLSGLRDYASKNAPSYLNVEPEYLSYNDGKLYVSLQENNGLAQFDVQSGTWSNIWSLGTREQTIDASDRDGGLLIDDLVHGLPMPDTIGSFRKNGKTYIVTANEGDAVTDASADLGTVDEARVKDLGKDGNPSVDPATEAALNLIYGNYKSDAALGRYTVSIVDGDTDGDGDIDVLTGFGGRGFSIYDDTGALVYDSNSLEALLASIDPTIHNAEAEGAFEDGDPMTETLDSRSDNKGPEPEALDVIETFDGTVLMAIGMERQNGILLFDLTDPSNPLMLDYVNSFGDGMAAPESLEFFFGEDGKLYLLAGYEVSGNFGVYEIPAYLVPEPSTYAALAGLLGLGFVLWRRRRA